MSKIEGIKSWERVSTGGGGWSKRDEWGVRVAGVVDGQLDGEKA